LREHILVLRDLLQTIKAELQVLDSFPILLTQAHQGIDHAADQQGDEQQQKSDRGQPRRVDFDGLAEPFSEVFQKTSR
jgi:hypothetical protein